MRAASSSEQSKHSEADSSFRQQNVHRVVK